MLDQISGAFHFQGRQPQFERVEDYFQGIIGPFGEICIYFQADGDRQAPEAAGAKTGGSVCTGLHVPFGGQKAQGFQPYRQGVLRQLPGDEHGIYGEAGFGLFQIIHLQSAVQAEPTHAEHGVQGIYRISKYHDGPV